MKRIIIIVILIISVIFTIPVIILGGFGGSIKMPGVFSRFIPSEKPSVPSKPEEAIYIKLYNKELNKIVSIGLEEYIEGVLAAEMPVNFEMEALKAQAVTARTFALSHLVAYGGSGCAKHRGADLCSETHCQAWISKEERFKYWESRDAEQNWKKIVSAVEGTRGIVITSKGKLADRVKYFSTSDGKTENAVNVFGYRSDYLVSVISPGEEKSPSFSSTVIISRNEFISRIKALDAKVKIDNKHLAKQISIIQYTEGGRVGKLKVGDKSFTGIQIRWAFNLKSADFAVSVDSKNIIFKVRGYGHGVGLSQWGANIMAQKGAKYEEIIKHYFKGTDIKNYRELK